MALLDAPGVPELEGAGRPLLDAAGAGSLARLWLVPAVGEVLPIGSGSPDELGVAADDGELEDDGDALDCKPHNALVTGSADGDELELGVALPDGRANGDALLDGRSAGFGPLPPSANAVAATDATIAAVTALNATERLFIRYTSVPNPSPGPYERNGHPGHTAWRVRCSWR